MAILLVEVDHQSLAFSTLHIETVPTQNLAILFTNLDPVNSVDVELAPPSSPFAIDVADQTFTLAPSGTKSVNVSFTPTASGSFSDSSLIGTLNNGFSWSGGFSGTFLLTGAAWSSTYTLPNITNMACGTIKPTLFMPVTAPQITVPSNDSFSDITDIIESVQNELSSSSASPASVSIIDDYSTYAEGFWWHISTLAKTYGAFKLRFYLEEDGVDTFLYFGTIQAQQTTWDEYEVGTVNFRRTADLHLLSAEGFIYSIDTSVWATEVLSHAGSVIPFSVGGPRLTMLVVDLFECLLTCSGLNTWVSEGGTDIEFVYDGANLDFQYFFGATISAWNYLSVSLSEWKGASEGEGYIDVPQWDNADASIGFATVHATLQDIISALLFRLQCTMRFTYDVATERHKIKVIQLGHSYSSTISPDDFPIESRIIESNNLVGDAVRVQIQGGTQYVWQSRKYMPDGATESTPPIPSMQFDVDKSVIFDLAVYNGSYPLTQASGFGRIIFLMVSGVRYMVDAIKVWRYDTGAYYDKGSIDTYTLIDAVCKYVFYKIPTEGKRQLNRTYPDMKFGGSHVNASIMRRTSVDLGDGAVNWYANKVNKKVSDNNLEVEWIEE